MNRQFFVCAAALISACSGNVDQGTDGNVQATNEAIIRPTANGGRNEVVMVYAVAFNSNGQLVTRTCSGSYFAPRVVLTAAHCLQNIFFGQLFVYWGDNFAADFAELTQIGDTFVPPVLGQPSNWAMAESFEQHPKWDPTLFHPDMGAIYLDRKPPFDPLPLMRSRLDNSWLDKTVTVSGWGANVATGPITATGSRVQRTGTTKVLGTPTLADFHPDDPNPGMLNAAVRSDVVKVDGHAPNSSSCFGDSGGPIIVNQFGQDYIAGVDYWGGLFCEDYALYTRIDPFLPFLDQAYKKGGQETLIPNLECVAPNPSGTLTAYFGYNNKNGVSMNVPYGSKNQLALDTIGWRPTKFAPGVHSFQFGADFTANQTVSYSLAPDNSPRTTISVNRNSPRCGADKAAQIECGNLCRAQARSGCTNMPPIATCLPDCLSNNEFFAVIAPECVPATIALDVCKAAVPPGVQNWSCFPGSLPDAPACQAELDEWLSCNGF